ncbi:unnamed protein product [Adineta ricciae]|uniref:G-protein coupled receptors family 1 profile domain-containing protein n=1 Tax=Adineta ricciae TaxID=249248 RepID=A0A813MME8_ADIRI|nr:unnamed protein product [Adineta ricciae]CAF1196772.1 unnamed protein product [Adineta ricciae]
MNLSITSTSTSNTTNDTCPTPLLWPPKEVDSRKSRLIVCIIAVFVHTIFWLQPIFCSSIRQKSMQWIYVYLVTDIFLIFRFFFTYIVRTTTTDCEPDPAWITFVCYFDATFDNYFNVLEVYILLALNICRYIQIAYNVNVYQVYKKLLVIAHVSIYALTAISTIIQLVFGWAQLLIIFRSSCQVTYTNIYIQVFNIITAFALPILLNVVVIYMSVRHVRLTSTLQRATHVSAREKYNRTLVIQFLIFYLIWVSLWSPNVILYQISGGTNLVGIFRLLNSIEIALDPIILAALDVRFCQAWRRMFNRIKSEVLKHSVNQGRIGPTTTRPNMFSIKTAQLRTTVM